MLVGVNVAVQSRINGEFGQRIGDGVYVAVLSFGTGLVCAIVFVLLNGRARAGIPVAAAALRDGRLRWWQLTGGLGGAMYVASQSITVATLGVALFTVCIVAGQTGNSLIVDRLGLGPGGARAFTVARVSAAAITVLAVGIGVSDRWNLGDFKPLYVLLVVAAGAAAAFQQAFNGQVARVSDSAPVSSLVNFVVGFLALVLVLGVDHLLSGDTLPSLPSPLSGDWWLYLGGPMGFAYTLGLALVVRTLGVLVFGLCAIAGQLLGALLLDVIAPAHGGEVTWQLVVAVSLTLVAVLLAGSAQPRLAGAPMRRRTLWKDRPRDCDPPRRQGHGLGHQVRTGRTRGEAGGRGHPARPRHRARR